MYNTPNIYIYSKLRLITDYLANFTRVGGSTLYSILPEDETVKIRPTKEDGSKRLILNL